jgi:hypothetical protein
MEKYIVRHTVDDSGAVYMDDECMTDLVTGNLCEAIELADELTSSGKCGYVERKSDGALLCPDGKWCAKEDTHA